MVRKSDWGSVIDWKSSVLQPIMSKGRHMTRDIKGIYLLGRDGKGGTFMAPLIGYNDGITISI